MTVTIPEPDIDSLVAESHEIAARLAARFAGRDFDKLEHHLAAIGELMEMHADTKNAALRRHVRNLLLKLRTLIEVGDYVSAGEEVEAELKGFNQ